MSCEQIKVFLTLTEKARELATDVAPTSCKLKHALTITGTYKTPGVSENVLDNASANRVSWKTLLVRDIEAKKAGLSMLAANETTILRQLDDAGLTSHAEWSLIPSDLLLYARGSPEQPSHWVLSDPNGQKSDNNYVTLIHLPSTSGKTPLHTSGTVNLQGKQAINHFIYHSLLKDPPSPIMACRSCDPEELSHELKTHHYMATPIRWHKTKK